MAQAQGGSFDWRLREKEEICLRLLRSAADQIALGRPPAPDPRTLAAVLLRVLAADWSGLIDFKDERAERIRSLEDWIGVVSTPELECSSLLKTPDSPMVAVAVAEVVDVLARATISWSTGTPEEPSTDSTFRVIRDALLRLGVLHRAPRAGF